MLLIEDSQLDRVCPASRNCISLNIKKPIKRLIVWSRKREMYEKLRTP